MTKRIFAFALALVLALSLVACGGEPAQPSGPKDYAAIITAARADEDNEANVIFTLKDGAYTASGAYADELTAENIEEQGAMTLQMLGLLPDDVAEAYYSVSMMMVQSYGIAVIKPAEGKTEAVQEGLQSFIEGQKAAQENYLADQFEIAKNAKLDTLKTGEVVLVMCEGQNAVFDSIKAALK